MAITLAWHNTLERPNQKTFPYQTHDMTIAIGEMIDLPYYDRINDGHVWLTCFQATAKLKSLLECHT